MSDYSSADVPAPKREIGVRATVALFAVVFIFVALVVGSTLLSEGSSQRPTHTMQDGSLMTGDMQAPGEAR